MLKYSMIKNSKVGIIIFLLALSLLPINRSSAQTSNAGFVPGNIWYSIDPFTEGDNIKIYTVIFNPDTRELSGTVVFFDNNVFFAKKDFTISAKSVKDVSIDWVVTAGDHSIFAKIENAKFLISAGKYENVYLAENESSKSTRTVNKKVIAKIPDPVNTNLDISKVVDSVSNIGQDSISNIGQIVQNNTPSFISGPIIATTDAVEAIRKNIGTASKNKQTEIKKELDLLNSNDTKTDSKQNAKKTPIFDFIKPFKFSELFALALFSNIFDNKFIFYTLLFLFIFLLLRYIVKRVR